MKKQRRTGEEVGHAGSCLIFLTLMDYIDREDEREDFGKKEGGKLEILFSDLCIQFFILYLNENKRPVICFINEKWKVE